MTIVPHLALTGGGSIPQVGFGVYQLPADETAAIVGLALKAGYRGIDTARVYRNEAGVGAAVRSSELPRRDLFVTTKLWNDDQGYDSALRAFDRSLAELELDYVDLYLIHWPAASRGLYIETWRALERILADGRARSIGVSNFQVEHLTRLLDVSDTVPAVNQIELHPRLQQKQLREFHARHGIVTQAWSPLARGAFLDDPVIGTIAAEHAVTPARVVLRWHLQLGNAIIPKSATPSRIEENLDLFSFELDDAELSAISRLDTGERTGPDPDRMT